VPNHAGPAANGFVGTGFVINGPSDMVDVAPGNVLPGSGTTQSAPTTCIDPDTLEVTICNVTTVTHWYTSYIITIHPIRPGTYHAAVSFAVGDSAGSIFIVCLTFNVTTPTPPTTPTQTAPGAPTQQPTQGNI
jgi:hypothetical protein